jgi:hypothetical protein
MLRSFIPFILASLGFTLISWATKVPLFEWQFSEIVTDFSSACDGTLPSRWTTRIGEDLEAKNRPSILANLNIVVRRHWLDETLHRISLSLYDGRPLFFIGVLLSISYMWWFLFQDKQEKARPIVMAVFLTLLAVIVCVFLSQAVIRHAGPAVGQIPYYYDIRHCYGAITFLARLSKVHYETLIVLLGSILSEVSALGVIVLEVLQIARKRTESSKLAVG